MRWRGPLVSLVSLAVVLGALADVVDASQTGDAALSRPSPFPATTASSVPAGHPEPGLPALLAGDGYQLPAGASVYAVKVLGPPGEVTGFASYEAGEGAHATDFWPASSIKVLVAVGALEFLHTMGFTGAATVSTDDGWSDTVDDLYVAAIRDSSNDAYDRLVQIAGYDWLNTVFLTPANGFPATVVQRSYSGLDVTSSPEMTVTEGSNQTVIPARTSTADYGCPDSGNCSDLFEMVDSIRRVVLDAELPAAERFPIDPADIAGLTGALAGADGFLGPGVAAALGDGSVVYDKPGWVAGLECVDVALVVSPTGERFLLGEAAPDDGSGCDVLAGIAQEVLQLLA
jgi:hypothetical protein